MSTEKPAHDRTQLDETADRFAAQCRAVYLQLPPQDFHRVTKHTLGEAVEVLLRSMLVATREMTDTEMLAHSLRSHGERLANTAQGLDRLSGMANPRLRHTLSTRTAELQAEADELIARSDRLLAGDDTDGDKRV